MNSLDELKAKITTCHACYLRKHYDKPVPFICGDNPEVMFIGEAPGADEVEKGKPFVGRSGKMLQTAIRMSGLTFDQIFVTNIICCRPLNNVFPDDNEPILACRPWIDAQIQLVKPKIIVAVGGQAHRHFRGSAEGITKACGNWQLYTLEGDYQVWYMPTLHPSFCLRGGDPNSTNAVMKLDSKGKEALLREHIATIPNKLKELTE